MGEIQTDVMKILPDQNQNRLESVLFVFAYVVRFYQIIKGKRHLNKRNHELSTLHERKIQLDIWMNLIFFYAIWSAGV